MSFRTVLIENPCRLYYQSGYMVVRKEDDTVKIHLSEISSIVLQTMQVNISAYLLSELAKQKVSLVTSDEKCNPLIRRSQCEQAHRRTACLGRANKEACMAKNRKRQNSSTGTFFGGKGVSRSKGTVSNYS